MKFVLSRLPTCAFPGRRLPYLMGKCDPSSISGPVSVPGTHLGTLRGRRRVSSDWLCDAQFYPKPVMPLGVLGNSYFDGDVSQIKLKFRLR